MTTAAAPTARLALPPVLDLAAAAPLKIAMAERLGSALVLEAGDVRRLGAQCLQLLLAAKRRWAADGRAFSIASPSPAFCEALAAFGVGADLEPVR